MKLKPGDKIIGTYEHNLGIVRVITRARKKGYTWIYPEVLDQDFVSENSCDPLFEWGWKQIDDEIKASHP